MKRLQEQEAELEYKVRERAELVKKMLREYRESTRPASSRGRVILSGQTKGLDKKKREVERANAEYIQLRKELDMIRSKLHERKSTSRPSHTR